MGKIIEAKEKFRKRLIKDDLYDGIFKRYIAEELTPEAKEMILSYESNGTFKEYSNICQFCGGNKYQCGCLSGVK